MSVTTSAQVACLGGSAGRRPAVFAAAVGGSAHPLLLRARRHVFVCLLLQTRPRSTGRADRVSAPAHLIDRSLFHLAQVISGPAYVTKENLCFHGGKREKTLVVRIGIRGLTFIC
ncbi:hypothetical protein SEVIR_4G066900v4 [Setaria viridis]|uniref:Uncharacterized protein n=1 Tax=Setaria viridis TaxID=4556 RepID=A0A4U6V0I5_SETVI|nr:hypothetical protein SEVIR_4G066900v2 [Setaria viridis]